jgi:hypothetical protein
LEAEIILRYKNAKTAQAIANAISPDNLKVPSGMAVKTSNLRKIVQTKIEFDGAFSTFVATIDDLLSSVSTAEKTVQTVVESQS